MKKWGGTNMGASGRSEKVWWDDDDDDDVVDTEYAWWVVIHNTILHTHYRTHTHTHTHTLSYATQPVMTFPSFSFTHFLQFVGVYTTKR